MRLENEQLHYRARFEVFPYETQNPAMSKIQQILWDWLRNKERRRKGGDLFETLSAAGARDAFFDGTLETNYSGGLNVEGQTRLAIDAFTSERDDRTLWAMEYDEPDSRVWFRHWHTRVGLSGSKSGFCLVNVRITYYTLPSYVGNPGLVPFANVPNFVREIVELGAYQSCVGETVLNHEETYLTSDNIDEEFTSNLLSEQRELPLVLMCTDESGATPVWDAADLAKKLIGMANVYVADWREAELRGRLRELFPRDTPAFQYRCGASMLRIYRPGIDLSDPDGWRTHTFFPKGRIDHYCKRGPNEFVDTLSRGLGRSITKGESDILELGDVEWARSSRASEELSRRLEEMRASSLIGKPVGEGAAASEKRVEELEGELRESQWFLGEYERENASLRGTTAELKSENNELSSENSTLKYRLGSVEDRARSLEAEVGEVRGALEAISAFDRIPSTLSDLLDFVEGIWPSRIVVLDEARSSAQSFNGDLNEEWQIIRSVATVLWSLYFDDDVMSCDVASEYKVKAGYELALTEKKQTKADQKKMSERRRWYKGAEIDITPHIKGKNKNPKLAFRLHYYVDRDDRKIVVGHCGAHLTTSGTRRIS